MQNRVHRSHTIPKTETTTFIRLVLVYSVLRFHIKVLNGVSKRTWTPVLNFAFLDRLCFFRKNEQKGYASTIQSRVKAFSSNTGSVGELQKSIKAQKRENDARNLKLFVLT